MLLLSPMVPIRLLLFGEHPSNLTPSSNTGHTGKTLIISSVEQLQKLTDNCNSEPLINSLQILKYFHVLILKYSQRAV